MKKIMGNQFKYKKNSNEIYDILKKSNTLENAIKNATKLESEYSGKTDFANHNPCTKVHHLVMELFDLKGINI